MLNPNGARHGDALERGMGAARPTERPGAQPACRAGRSGAGEHLTGRLRAARGLGAGGHLLSARVAAPSRGAPCALPGWHLRRFPVLLGRWRGIHADLQHADRLVAGHDNDLQRCPQTPISSRGWPPAAGLPPSHGAGAGRAPGSPPPAREHGEPRAVLLLWLQFCSCSCSFAPLDCKSNREQLPGLRGAEAWSSFPAAAAPPNLALCAPTCSLTVSGASWVCTASGSMVSPGRRERAGGAGSHLPHAASEGHRSLSPSHRAPRGHALGAERARRRTFQEAAEESVSPPRRGWGCGASPVCLVRVKTHSGGQASTPLLSHRAWGDEG